MEAKASARFTRIAPRKARVVVNLIRGRNVAEAVDMLRFTKKGAAPIVAKVLDSAIANARNKDQNVDLDALIVRTAHVDKAPDSMMRRFRPRAMGRATRIVKGMSHITLIVGQKAEA